MSILKTLQDFLLDFGMDMAITEIEGEVLNIIDYINTDVVDKEPTSFALAPSGNTKIKEDILGNKTYQNSYVFYAKENAMGEADRQDTYNFLEAFSAWVDSGVLPSLQEPYRALKLEVSNGILIDMDENKNGLYQIQIQFIYHRRVID